MAYNWTDPDLNLYSPVRSVHITELRQRTNEQRQFRDLPIVQWTVDFTDIVPDIFDKDIVNEIYSAIDEMKDNVTVCNSHHSSREVSYNVGR